MKTKSFFKNHTVDGHIFIIIGLMAVLCIVMLILNPESYFTEKNLRSMLFQFPEYGILSLGMMLCMMSGGIDLSLVGIMNLSGVCAALIIKNNVNENSASAWPVILTAVLTAVAVGALCGLFNGFIIGYFKMPAMLVTLATLQLFTGLVYGITGGPAINGMCDEFKEIANGTIPGTKIPWVILIFLFVLAVIAFILKFTVFGRNISFLGSGLKTAVFSGINTLKVTLLTYMTSGILGGISGILITSHLNSAKSSNGSAYTLLTILVAVLGGVHPDGGKGTVSGVALSIVFMQMVSNAFTIMHISQDAKNFANGCLLIVTLMLTQIIHRAIEKKKNSD